MYKLRLIRDAGAKAIMVALNSGRQAIDHSRLSSATFLCHSKTLAVVREELRVYYAKLAEIPNLTFEYSEAMLVTLRPDLLMIAKCGFNFVLRGSDHVPEFSVGNFDFQVRSLGVFVNPENFKWTTRYITYGPEDLDWLLYAGEIIKTPARAFWLVAEQLGQLQPVTIGPVRQCFSHPFVSLKSCDKVG